MKSISWMDQGACVGIEPDLFFPEYEAGNHTGQQAQADQARQICWTCPVRVQCRDYARSHKITDGIWGGVWLDRGKKRKKEARVSLHRNRTPEQAARWRANADAKAAAKHAAFLEAQRDRMAGYTPPNVRTYGEPWDSRIAAASLSAVPLAESPNKGTKR